MCARNSDEYFTKFISNKFLNFFRFIFYSIVDQNFKMKDYTNLNNCHNCFFMPCSYKITCHIKYFSLYFGQPSLKLERPVLKIHILWYGTDTCSLEFPVKVSLMSNNPFPVPFLCKLKHSSVYFIQNSMKIVCK